MKTYSFIDKARACCVVLAASLAIAISAVDRAGAQTSEQLCAVLEARLAGGETGKEPQEFAGAVQRQRRELDKARIQARAQGCDVTAFIRFDPKSGTACSSLLHAISKMEQNLALYEQAAADGMAQPGERSHILSALESNGCAGGDPQVTGSLASADPAQSLPSYRNRIVVKGPGSEWISELRGERGNYRTMCVRTCDGYYFPISYSSGMPDFARDADQCRARCPGARVELYFHSVPDQESEEMISLTGMPYMKQPFALKYRSASQRSGASCGCGTVSDGSFEYIGGSPKNAAIPEAWRALGSVEIADTSPPVNERTGPHRDSETVIRENTGEKSVAKGASGIRVVGPAFLPDPSEAINLQAPARKSVP